MKLSEVIKAIEDGKMEKAKSDRITISRHDTFFNIFLDHAIKIAIKLDDDWKEVKPPRQWSEKELMLFKLLPDWAKWIATNSVGDVFVFDSEPRKVEGNISEKRYGFSNYPGQYVRIVFDFLTITFEESPVYIGDLKGE